MAINSKKKCTQNSSKLTETQIVVVVVDGAVVVSTASPVTEGPSTTQAGIFQCSDIRMTDKSASFSFGFSALYLNDFHFGISSFLATHDFIRLIFRHKFFVAQNSDFSRIYCIYYEFC